MGHAACQSGRRWTVFPSFDRQPVPAGQETEDTQERAKAAVIDGLKPLYWSSLPELWPPTSALTTFGSEVLISATNCTEPLWGAPRGGAGSPSFAVSCLVVPIRNWLDRSDAAYYGNARRFVRFMTAHFSVRGAAERSTTTRGQAVALHWTPSVGPWMPSARWWLRKLTRAREITLERQAGPQSHRHNH